MTKKKSKNELGCSIGEDVKITGKVKDIIENECSTLRIIPVQNESNKSSETKETHSISHEGTIIHNNFPIKQKITESPEKASKNKEIIEETFSEEQDNIKLNKEEVIKLKKYMEKGFNPKAKEFFDKSYEFYKKMKIEEKAYEKKRKRVKSLNNNSDNLKTI